MKNKRLFYTPSEKLDVAKYLVEVTFEDDVACKVIKLHEGQYAECEPDELRGILWFEVGDATDIIGTARFDQVCAFLGNNTLLTINSRTFGSLRTAVIGDIINEAETAEDARMMMTIGVL